MLKPVMLIYHEYTHNVIVAIYGRTIGNDTDNPGDAMDEGLSDYFAASITGDSRIGESVGLSRDLDNMFQWSADEDGHWNGQVIGGAVWDVGNDQLVFTALQITPHAFTFEDFGYNMVLADREHNGGGNESIIRDAFRDHGITIRDTPVDPGGSGGSVAIDTVIIVGPASLTNWQYGTWTASVEGGRPPYTYQWEYMPLCGAGGRREVGCNTWSFGGSEPSYSRMANRSFDLKLKLTVTDTVPKGSNASPSSKSAYKTVRTVAFKKNGAGVGQQQGHQAGQQVLPDSYVLEGNYPNPFNPSTEIRFALPKASKVSLVVYDMAGRMVAELLDGSLAAGSHSVPWNASNLPSDAYVYRLRAGTFAESKLMTLLK